MGQQFDSSYAVLEVQSLQCESTVWSVHWYSFPISDKYSTRNTCSSCRFCSYLQDIKYSTNYKIHCPLNATIILWPETGQFTSNNRGWHRNHMRLWLVTGNCSIVCSECGYCCDVERGGGDWECNAFSFTYKNVDNLSSLHLSTLASIALCCFAFALELLLLVFSRP